MHLLVTDRLACPRCGPAFGLVLVADELEERRVLRGFLGCSNCRDRYPVEGGFGDLRPAPRGSLPAEALDHRSDPEAALKVAALLGIRDGPGLLFLTGSSVRHADILAGLVEGIEVVAAHHGLRDSPESSGVSRVACGGRLPFFNGSLRGAVLEGVPGRDALGEGIRILASGARLVLLDPPGDALEQMEAGGIELLMESDSVLVGARK
ncbi:MAG: hypothetical protein EXR92_00290 [Gemmatimonadetes bacterium]|nr:hypothetical protein [Gemmatimonadota bacterium]